ncbi:sugar porter family MFS transporter [Corynebacterium sp. CCM 9185]|uniref:Sugar porter family MFS transporter n=1 Tax=Corynebacterium marambiense TaxID=2765364 RepID=A0ABS0VVA9_9CORY|nr:sugar porter family MFS transporter [Corynebacterium marambiense]MBI9000703.1 sugar porter family MFS transporter [Corynebacterium marambiense]MCK7663034.1 sugar porter family MFS transporter [Corynebacterium marambiense]
MSFIRDLKSAPPVGRAIALTAAALGITYGYDISNIAAALLYLEKDFGLDTTGQATMATAVVVGQIFGAIAGGPMANAIGRKKTMLIVAGGYVIFSVASAFAPTAGLLVFLRALLGVTIGLSITVVPVFIAESSPNRIRGGLLTSYQVTTVLGIIVGYLVGWGLSFFESWRWMLGAAAIPAAIVFVALLKISETPQWLVMRGRTAEARAVLLNINSPKEAEEEFTSISQSVNQNRGGNDLKRLGEMFRGPISRATIFAIALGFFIQITGINATIYYAPRIFEQMGFHGTAQQLLLPAVVQTFGLAAVLVSMVVIDSFGRRKVLLSGIATMILADILLILVYRMGSESSTAFLVLGFIGIVLFTMGFTGGFGAIVWVYAGELFPTRYRALGASLVLTADLIANAIVAQLFPPLLEAVGGAGVFAIFGVFAGIAFVTVFRYAPETKGRKLEDIQSYWENGATWSGPVKA